VLGIVSIFTYGLAEGIRRLAEAGVANHSLSNFEAVCRAAAESGAIRPDDIERLRRFQANPKEWREC
ncbi:MAG: orotate phosphoribosyltransferase, partial [Kiritimatiellae bacterium]|nr:orotate phosphoribosyltransferase [Kiritimatiellia bacterium]